MSASVYKILAVLCITLAILYLSNYYLNTGENNALIEKAIKEDAAIHRVVGAVESIKITSRTKVEASSDQRGYVSYRANVRGELRSIVVKVNIISSDLGAPVITIAN